MQPSLSECLPARSPATPDTAPRRAQADPTNCNVYVGNISPEVEHEELRAIIASYGPLVSMRMYRKEGYGFAEFENHHDAVRAILGARPIFPNFRCAEDRGVGLVQYSALHQLRSTGRRRPCMLRQSKH